MWGIWFIVTFGGSVGVLVLIGALAFGLFSPLLALLAFVIVVSVLAAVAAFKRSAEYVEETEGETATGARSPRTAGAPVTGEGD